MPLDYEVGALKRHATAVLLSAAEYISAAIYFEGMIRHKILFIADLSRLRVIQAMCAGATQSAAFCLLP